MSSRSLLLADEAALQCSECTDSVVSGDRSAIEAVWRG